MSVDALVREIAELDVGAADLASVREQLARIAKVESWVAARKLDAKRRLDELNEQGVTVSPERDVENHGNTSRKDANELNRRRAAADALPELAKGLEDGSVSPGHLDALGRGLAGLEEEDRRKVIETEGERLARLARRTTPDEFAKHVRNAAALAQTDGGIPNFEKQRRANSLRTWVDPITGMVHGKFELDPESGAKLTGRLRNIVEDMFHDTVPDTCPTDPVLKQNHLRALALISLIDGTAAGGRRPDLICVIGLDTLRNGVTEASIVDVDGALNLPVETLRRIACNANIIPAVLDGNGALLDMGRGKRLATEEQRRALRAMYPTCFEPDCPVPFEQCDIHHIDYWENGGRSDLGNFIPGCCTHHHAVHEGGWKLSLDPVTRVLTITDRDGTSRVVPAPYANKAA